MKKLRDIKCIDILCINCPLRIFGCTARSKTFGAEKEAKWSMGMTLGEILGAKFDSVSESVKNNEIMTMAFGRAILCAEIALSNYIDEEDLLQDD